MEWNSGNTILGACAVKLLILYDSAKSREITKRNIYPAEMVFLLLWTFFFQG